jgi:hypothetical protein
LAGEIKKSIKSNIINPSIKYKNEQEKVGEVLEINEDAGTCTVSLVTRDGIKNVIYNVAVLHNEEGIIPWQPEAGDLVRLKEQYKRFVITGKFDMNTLNQSALSLYDDIYADITGGGCGYSGY